ncbi:HECT-domain-containing protein [Artomyces pyxidatus]|uniref:HECT-domain-containing protein n=1 Tax=Artomyces pyxidatus TaxID=48021 RepID=A0ACB8SY83_9AGAM|nr:HECT-domain-containing protein [Artomyces pyxidatus]
MIPLLGQEQRRNINLGGARSSQSHAAILDQARARRSEREDERRRRNSAVKIQAWWRGRRDHILFKQKLTRALEDDISGLTGLRALVVVGRNEALLAQWSTAIVNGGDTALFQHAVGPQRESWLVLIRQVALLLLQSVAEFPQSSHAMYHLQILDALLSTSTTTRVLGPQGVALTIELSRYLLNHDLYAHLAKALSGIPVDAKQTPALAYLAPLLTNPLQAFAPDWPEFYSVAYVQLVHHIFSLPLLPNRFPLTSLQKLSANLQLQSISVISSSIPDVLNGLSVESRVHVLANLYAFVPYVYTALSAPSLATVLDLFTAILNTIPPRSFQTFRSTATAPLDVRMADPDPDPDPDSDDEDADHLARVSIVTSFAPPPALPELDTKTLARLKPFPGVAHITKLLSITQRHSSTRPSLYSLILALCTVWSKEANSVLSFIVVSTGGGVVRELYRGFVRNSPLGRDESVAALTDPTTASAWPPLLFLADLYSQSLLTMGDDEFFSSISQAAASNAPRNPLTIDELIVFSRQLLNVAFTLYWREEEIGVERGTVPGMLLSWEGARAKVTRCLQAIHARDSRRPFTPPEHWLVDNILGTTSFVNAAIFDDMQMANAPGTRALSKRDLTYLSARLGVLHNIPFALAFNHRVEIFREFIAYDMETAGAGRRDMSNFHKRARATVRRGHVAEDGFDKLGDADLRMPIEIRFIDAFGEPEAGIDGGGVFKEFLTELCKEVFDTDRGLWLANKNNEIYPNPGAYATEPHSLNWYRFIGRILGKALYEGILVDVVFAGFFLARWLGKQSFLDDLRSLDPELYNGLLFLKHYPGDPEELSLNFTVADEEFGVAKTIDLIPNGSNVTVTRTNKLEYITRVSHYRLNRQIKRQSAAFFEGLSDIIDPKWLRMFNQQELQILLGGVDTPVNLEELRRYTQYGGLYNANHPTIVAFWNVVNTFDAEQRRALLRFVTSVGRPPLLGFKELYPHFSIRDAAGAPERLPTSSTCVNLLKLPRYESEKLLREKVLQAITSGAGFDLS